jgi:hypothetical protein
MDSDSDAASHTPQAKRLARSAGKQTRHPARRGGGDLFGRSFVILDFCVIGFPSINSPTTKTRTADAPNREWIIDVNIPSPAKMKRRTNDARETKRAGTPNDMKRQTSMSQ